MSQDSKRKDIHFAHDRLFEDDSRYDPEDDLPDFEPLDQELEETEEEFRSAVVENNKKKRPAA